MISALPRNSLIVGSVAIVVSAAATRPLIGWLRHHGTLDYPTHRSSHATPTPRGGGLAVILGTILGLMAAGSLERKGLVIAFAALALGIVGAIEDFRGLSAAQRFGAQFVVALIAVPLIVGFEPGVVLGVLFVVGFTNATNFMDGINGISASQMIVAGTVYAYLGFRVDNASLALAGVAIASSSFGFLPFNFPNAKIFLGDSGSYFCGAWIALTVVLGIDSGTWFIALLAPLAIYGIDTLVTLVRRTLERKPIFEPHREHTYQRLVLLGWSHARTTGFVAVLSAMNAILALSVRRSEFSTQVLAVALIGSVLAAYLGAPALLAVSRSKRSPQT